LFSRGKALNSIPRSGRQLLTTAANTSYQTKWKPFAIGAATMTSLGAFCFATLAVSSAEQESSSKEDLSAKYERKRADLIGNYEDRIRKFSAPEKVFTYFASQKDKNGNPAMTSDDFLRSMIPYSLNNSANNIALETNKASQQEKMSRHFEKFAKLADEDGDGLISFSEYVFFTTLLSISNKQIEIAFKLFDSNGNGEVDVDEFMSAISAIRAQTVLGSKQRSPKEVELKKDSGLLKYFFGSDESNTLKLESFVQFVTNLQTEFLKAEFDMFEHDDKDTISAYEYGLCIVSKANPNNAKPLLRNLDKLSKSPVRISFEDYHKFHHLLKNLDDMKIAFNLVSSKDKGCDKETFKRITKVVIGSDISDHQLDILFTIFDENGDGHINDKEFFSVMRLAVSHGLDRKREVGFVEFAFRVKDCVLSD